MAVLEITKMGNPVLRKVAEQVPVDEINTEQFQKLINDMEETMVAASGIGIAAPQVGISKQVALIKVDEENKRYPGQESTGLIVFINPVVEPQPSESQGFWEGCLSVPGLRGYVERPSKVKISFLDRQGNPQEIVADDFSAVVFQHELDHLQGILYVDRVAPGYLVFDEEFDKFVAAAED